MSDPFDEAAEAIRNAAKNRADVDEKFKSAKAEFRNLQKAYIEYLMGADTYTKGAGLIKRYLPVVSKFAGGPAVGAALASMLANSENGTLAGLAGVLKRVLLLPGLVG